MSIPEHVLPRPRPDEIAALLRDRWMLALRYPSSSQPGIPGGLYVCRNKNYSIQSVARGFRSALNRGLARCEIRPVTPDELLTEGLECNRDTIARQGRESPEFSDPKRWQRFVEAAWQVPSIEVTGAFIDGRLAAYQLGCLDDGWANIAYAFSRAALLEHRPNHALMFSTLGRYLGRPDVVAVCGGPKTILVEDGLHDFKARMGFGVEPHNVVVRFHPALEGLLANSATAKIVRFSRSLRPADGRLARTEAFLNAARLAREAELPATLAAEGRVK